jgi:hypothetical protein
MIGGSPRRVMRDVSVALSRFGIAMSEYRAKKWQATSRGCSDTCERVAKIVQPHILKPRPVSQAFPNLRQSDKVMPSNTSGENVRVMIKPGLGIE